MLIDKYIGSSYIQKKHGDVGDSITRALSLKQTI